MSAIHGATLNGTVNPNGLDTTVHFEYGTASSLGTVTPDISVPVGITEVPVSTDITTLDANTTYFFAVVATNVLGTSTGATLQFTTLDTDVPTVVTLDATNVS